MLIFCKHVFSVSKGTSTRHSKSEGYLEEKRSCGIRNGKENIILLDFYLFCKHFLFLLYRERNKGGHQYKLIYFPHSLFFSFDRIIIFLFFQVFFIS